MKEVSELAKGFDNRIVLSADNLYEKFGKENGKEILKPYFHEISWQEYKDKLEIQDAEPLIAGVQRLCKTKSWQRIRCDKRSRHFCLQEINSAKMSASILRTG